jgi:hypothetical protein
VPVKNLSKIHNNPLNCFFTTTAINTDLVCLLLQEKD